MSNPNDEIVVPLSAIKAAVTHLSNVADGGDEIAYNLDGDEYHEEVGRLQGLSEAADFLKQTFGLK